MTPSNLAEAGWFEALEGVIVKAGSLSGTCRMGFRGRDLDFFVVHGTLSRTFDKVELNPGPLTITPPLPLATVAISRCTVAVAVATKSAGRGYLDGRP